MRRWIWILPASFLFGVWLSVTFVNPYDSSLTLSYLVFQLGGARGDILLEFNMLDLLEFTLRLVPNLVFQAYAGTAFYRHYCTASVYIFSRIPKRLIWYKRESVILALKTLLYQGLIWAVAVVTAIVRWPLTPDRFGVWLLLFYWLIWSLWTYAFTLGINLVAIYLGSSSGFVLLASLQAVCISLLITLQAFESNKGLLAILQRANPITCLILCWQTSKLFDGSGELYLEDSLLLVLVLATTVTVAGGLIVQRHDLLISDTDGG